MNKTVSRYQKTYTLFGIKIGESNEKYEQIFMENVEPISSLIVTEYEMENIEDRKD